MINKKEQLYGSVLYRLVKNTDVNIRYNDIYSCYIIDNELALYCKYSTKRMSPWVFTFNKENNTLMEETSGKYSVFIALVCNDDGICCIDYNEYQKVVNFCNFDSNKISVYRKKRESYSVGGRSGALSFKINDSDFPRRLI